MGILKIVIHKLAYQQRLQLITYHTFSLSLHY